MKLKNLKSTCALLFLFVFNNIILANDIQISGRVNDATTQNAVSAAIVHFVNLNDGLTDSTLTDADGVWEYSFSTTSVKNNPNVPSDFFVS